MKISLQLYDMGVRLAIMRSNFLSVKVTIYEFCLPVRPAGWKEAVKTELENWAP